MTAMAPEVWLVAGYALLLLAIGWGFDLMARRVSIRSSRWRTGAFTYHEDHDAWRCPQDQWLWPTSFDPDNRVMRYRAKPSICNNCPVKSSCTDSGHGREVSREVDPWPFSEAGRFHRGIACFVALLGVVMPLGMLVGEHTPGEVAVLLSVALLVALGSVPLARHLWNTPVESPVHLPHRTALDDQAAAAIDRYSTRFGVRGD